jgi:VWFA-related protein
VSLQRSSGDHFSSGSSVRGKLLSLGSLVPGKLFTVILLSSSLLGAQDLPFRSTTRLVLAPVAVNDGQGRPVEGLTAKDFILYDSNTPVAIQIEDTMQPLSLVVVVQSSEHAQSMLDKLRRATSIIGPLITGARGEAAVVAFAGKAQVLQEFTRDTAKIENALRGLDGAGGGVSIIDGLSTALRLLGQRKSDRRRIVLLLSERHDQSSEESLEKLIELTERVNATIYSVTFSPTRSRFANRATKYCDRKCRTCANTCVNCGKHCDRENPEADPSNTSTGGGMNLPALFGGLKRLSQQDIPRALAELSGGTTSEFARKRALEDALQRIGSDLHEQYLVTLPMQRNHPGTFHGIRVQVKGRPDLAVRSRSGYFELSDE